MNGISLQNIQTISLEELISLQGNQGLTNTPNALNRERLIA